MMNKLRVINNHPLVPAGPYYVHAQGNNPGMTAYSQGGSRHRKTLLGRCMDHIRIAEAWGCSVKFTSKRPGTDEYVCARRAGITTETDTGD